MRAVDRASPATRIRPWFRQIGRGTTFVAARSHRVATPAINFIWSGYSADRIVAASARSYRYLARQSRAIKGPSCCDDLHRCRLRSFVHFGHCVRRTAWWRPTARIESALFQWAFSRVQSPGSRVICRLRLFSLRRLRRSRYVRRRTLTAIFANPIALFSMLRLFDDAMRLSARISCKHSVETKTVPSEDGGERKITITRC